MAPRSWATTSVVLTWSPAPSICEDLGCDFVIHHIGYDERRGIVGPRPPHAAARWISSAKSSQAVKVPVQAVGGLTLEQAVRTPGIRRAARRASALR
jgi:hypothetical protein